VKDIRCDDDSLRAEMSDPVRSSKMDKTVVSVSSLGEEPNDLEFWLSKTPGERFAAIEFMRTVNYGYNATSARLQRVLEIVELGAD